MAATKVITPFSLRDLWIKLPTDAPGAWTQVVGINQAQYKGSVTEVEYYGDDTRLGVFYHTQKGTISAKASMLSLNIIEKVTGVSASSGTTTYSGLVGSGVAVEVKDMQTIEELLPPRVAVRASMVGRHPDGTGGFVVAVWYSCTVMSAWETVPDAAFGKVDEVTLNFEAFASTLDENGAALTKKSFGRIEVS